MDIIHSMAEDMNGNLLGTMPALGYAVMMWYVLCTRLGIGRLFSRREDTRHLTLHVLNPKYLLGLKNWNSKIPVLGLYSMEYTIGEFTNEEVWSEMTKIMNREESHDYDVYLNMLHVVFVMETETGWYYCQSLEMPVKR